MYVRKEAVLSSQIEGTQSSLQNVLAAEARILSPDQPQDVNGHRVLEHLYEHPIISVNEVQGLMGTTYPAANDLVARMADIGILLEFTGQARNRRFRYQSYIGLFHDFESDAST